jgi:phage shock protein PspC (stress-responsive transcriptional regulator)
MISGVCSGIAEYFGIDPSIVRILWFVLSLASVGLGLIAYIACTIILPKDTDIGK